MEARRYDGWVERGLFSADTGAPGPAYCIVIPPPNVTGSLHMGHALDHTLMDALVRRRRMQGYTALWLPGMDHAGIATQNVVERELAKQGLSRHDLGREAFVERVWQWKAEYGGRILSQMRHLGDSVDWTRERFTMDEGLSRAVQTIFKRLFDDGLIYRADRIINWCPRCMTALSDIEVDHSDDDGELVVVRNGRYGPYVKRGDDTASVPPEVAPDELTVVRALASSPANVHFEFRKKLLVSATRKEIVLKTVNSGPEWPVPVMRMSRFRTTMSTNVLTIPTAQNLFAWRANTRVISSVPLSVVPGLRSAATDSPQPHLPFASPLRCPISNTGVKTVPGPAPSWTPQAARNFFDSNI